MSYPGNPSLAEDVRARILTTFRQSVEAAARGNRQEALLGSDFILRLDADFELARTLQQMLAAGEPAASYRALLEGLPVGRTPPPPAPQLASLAGSSPGLVASFARLLEARRFGDLLSAAQAQAAAVAGDPKVRELVETAQSRYEAEPFVRELLDHARRALGSGHLDEIDGLLEKARSLDPTHPGLAEIDRLRSSASASAAGSANGTISPAPEASRSCAYQYGVEMTPQPAAIPNVSAPDEICSRWL